MLKRDLGKRPRTEKYVDEKRDTNESDVLKTDLEKRPRKDT